MSSVFWPRLKWLLTVWQNIRKSAFPLAKYGTHLTLGGLMSSGAFGITFVLAEPVQIFSTLKLTINEASLIMTGLSMLTCLSGLLLIYLSVKVLTDKQPKIARVFILGLPSVEQNSFPDHLLSKSDLFISRVPVFLNEKEGTSANLQRQIEQFNAEASVDILSKFVLHNNCEQAYIGGLARVPFLVAYGMLLRQCAADIIYFDQSQTDAKRGFYLLDDEDEGIEIIFSDVDISPNENGDIGIAIGFSLPVSKEQLPCDISAHTMFGSTNRQTSRDMLLNQENLARISQEIGKQIDFLSAQPKVSKIHLFLSVQSVLAIDIGRRYQEGTHKKWVIHNFDGEQSKYTWALELGKGSIALYKADMTKQAIPFN